MIINNYNGSLPENTETNMTATKCPMINIRAFDASIKAGSSLIIPYYVSDFDQVEYRQEKLGPTFTTVFSLDEDTVPANQVRTWKQTTYAGEQVIDLGVIGEVGIHTLNVRTIQSNGVASATKPLKFIVHPAGSMPVLDFNSTANFSGKLSGYRRYTNVWRHSSPRVIGPIEEEYTCRYVVDKTVETVDGEDKTTDIRIIVIKPKGGYCLTHYGIQDDGGRTAPLDIDGQFDFTMDALGAGESVPGGYDSSTEEVVGVFHVTTRCAVGGSIVELADYLTVPMEQLPAEVVSTATKNKVALTRLFEAAKAWRFQQVYEGLLDGIANPTDQQKQEAAIEASNAVKYEFTFKMPKMGIVCDYHYAVGTRYYDRLGTLTAEDRNAGIHGEDGLDGTNTQTLIASYIRKYFHGRDDVMIPDGITIDMNGTTISMLQITNVKGGSLLHILNNVNSHIVNGNFVGNYKNIEFHHSGDMESLHTLSIHASLFCSFERVDVSFAAGYEMHIGNAEGQGIGLNDSVLIPFTNCGYINYDGEFVSMEPGDGGYGWHVTNGGSTCKVLNYGWTVCGRELRIRIYDESKAGHMHTTKNREMYVHFYDMQNNFVKTVKVIQRWPVLIPYGAWRMRITVYGSNSSSSGDDYLYSNDSNYRFGRFFCNMSWGCGVKNSNIHDTRSCTFDNGGVQTYIERVIFRNIAGERMFQFSHYDGDNNNISKMIIDQEDDGFNIYNWWMDGLWFIYGDTRAVRAGRGYDGHIKDCCNIHIDTGGEVEDLLIENSSVSISVTNRKATLGSGAHYTIRNCIIKGLDNSNSASGGPYELDGMLHIRNNTMFAEATGSGPGVPAGEPNVEEFDDIKL